jgi:hypothetical protein
LNNIEKQPVCHGPTNVAGIGGYLSSYQREKGWKSDFVTWSDNTMRQNHDFNLAIDQGHSTIAKLWIVFSWFFLAIVKYKIFHFYYGRTLLPFGLDLPFLRLFRKKIVMTYVGSEVRLIYLEKKRNKYWHLLKISADHPKYDRQKKVMLWWHNLWCHKFIATREQIEPVKEIIPDNKLFTKHWVINLGFNIENCSDPETINTSSTPVLVHAPSEPNIKGTKYVRIAIDELKNRGIEFEYKELIGVPNSEAQKIYSNADIIVDQFLVGGIGTLAFEGMGHGKPVVGYIMEEVLNKHMQDCPVFNANIDNLADRLEELIANPNLRLQLGRKGIEFAKKHLDPIKINEAVIDLYRSL